MSSEKSIIENDIYIPAYYCPKSRDRKYPMGKLDHIHHLCMDITISQVDNGCTLHIHKRFDNPNYGPGIVYVCIVQVVKL